LDYSKLVNEPAAILFHKWKELDQFFLNFTVPLFYFKGEIEPENLDDIGSAILVRLGDRFFALTAGHCVFGSASYNIVMGIYQKKHRFQPKFANRGHRQLENADYGYFEIAPTDGKTVESFGKVFLSADRILVTTSTDLKEDSDWVLLAGFPRSLLKATEHGHGGRLLTLVTTIEGTGEAPSSFLCSAPPNTETLDLWVPQEGLLDITSNNFPEVDLPVLAGTSGGGCWKSGVRPDPSSWSTAKLRFIGTHYGSAAGEQNINGKIHRFTRAVMIGHHLQLIAEDYKDLEELIFSKWPILSI
jgi:hypothetical protein